MGMWGPDNFETFMRKVNRFMTRQDRRSTATKSVADTAVGLADQASMDAASALVSANGKNVNYYEDHAPTGSDLGQIGDLWFVVSVPDGGTAGTVTGMYTYIDETSKWVQQVITSQVIGQLDAGQITTGTLTGVTITGVTITGATIQSAASGQRVSLTRSGLSFIDVNGVNRGGVAASISGNVLSGIGVNGYGSVLVGQNTSKIGTSGRVYSYGVSAGPGFFVSGGDLTVSQTIRDTFTQAALLESGGSGGTGRRVKAHDFSMILTDDDEVNSSVSALSVDGQGKVSVYADYYINRATGAQLFNTAGRMFEVLGLAGGQTLSTTGWTLLTTAFQTAARIDDGLFTWSRANGTLTFASDMRVMLDVAFAVLPANPDRTNRGIQVQCNSTTVDKLWVESGRSGSLGKKEVSGLGGTFVSIIDVRAGDVLRVYVNSSQTGAIGSGTAGANLDNTFMRVTRIR